MHIDETKKFDKRNVETNIRDGVVSKKEYEAYLSKLPDVSDKVFAEECLGDQQGLLPDRDREIEIKQKKLKKKPKAKGK